MVKMYQVVNDDDEIIGHKRREDIDWKKDIYRIGAVWLTNSKGEVLLAQRLLTKDKDPGKWGPAAAGTLEEGENYESNAYKEAEEEIGLSGVRFEKGPKQRFYEPRQAFCQWYLGICDKAAEEFTIQEDEVEQVAWVNIDELKKDLQKYPDKYVPSLASILAILTEATDF